MAVFSTISHLPPVSAHPLPPHPSPRQPQLAAGRVWLSTEASLWAPESTQIILCQIPRKGDKSKKFRKIQQKIPTLWMMIPHQPMQAATQVIHEMEQVLSPQPSTSSYVEKSPKTPSRKNPIVKLIRL